LQRMIRIDEWHKQCPDTVVKEDDRSNDEHCEANEFVKHYCKRVSKECGESNPNGSIGSGNSYPPPLSSRMSAGPIPHSSGPPSGYYGHSSNANANRGQRDYHQGPRGGYSSGPPPQGYDRMPPPRGYNQSHHRGGNYTRDERRFSGPPPRG